MQFNFLEKDIEDYIWSKITDGDIADRGLKMNNGIVYRQLSLPNAGIMDLVCVSAKKIVTHNNSQKFLNVQVFELKRGVIKCDDVGQLCRYKRAIEDREYYILDHFGMYDYRINVQGVLVGAGIDRDAHLLAQSLYEITVYRFDFDLDTGIEFIDITNAEDSIDIDLSGITDIDTKRLARASYPILDLYDRKEPNTTGANSDREQQSAVGETQSDTNE